MTDKTEILQEKERVIEAKSEILDLQTNLVGEKIFRDAQKRLSTWIFSVLALITTVAGFLAYWGIDVALRKHFDDAISTEVRAEVRAEVARQSSVVAEASARAETIMNEAIKTSRAGHFAVEAMENTLASIDTKIDALNARTDEVNARTKETEKFLTHGNIVSEIFVNTLYAMRSITKFCATELNPPIYPALRIKFALPYKVGKDSFDNFPMISPTRRLGIYDDNPSWSEGEDENLLQCVSITGDMDLTNSATPAFSDIRELPAIEGFYVDSASPWLLDDQIDWDTWDAIQLAFRQKWLNVGTVFLLLKVANNNIYIVRNADFFIETDQLGEDDDYLTLNPVTFHKDTSSPENPMLRAFFPLREPVNLSQLLK